MPSIVPMIAAAASRRHGQSQSDRPVSVEGGVLFAVCVIAGIIGAAITQSPVPPIAGILIGLWPLLSVKVANQWEKAVVLCLGRYKGLRGPGLFFVIPIIDRITPCRSTWMPSCSELIMDRDALGKELQRIPDAKTNPWGITVQSVEIRDVHIPAALEDAMSRQAQAERERQARIILGTAETEISSKFAEAAKVYIDNPVALHLRARTCSIKPSGKRVP